MRRWLEASWYGTSPLTWVLWPLSALFGLLVRLRRALYRAGIKRSMALPVPVIVVGSLAVGGAGKTPVTVWLARELKERGISVGVIASGYRGRATTWPQCVTEDSDAAEVGDEPVLLAKLTGCPVVAGPDRVAAAERLLADFPIDVVVSDDGLQHYRLRRRVEIAVIEGTRGFGNGLLVPAGPLREPPSRLVDVDAVIVSGESENIPGAFRARLVPKRVYGVASGERRRLSDFAGSSAHAVAGIANPRRFFEMLEAAGIRVSPHPLADHAEILPADLEFDDSELVLVTEKDAVKCRSFAAGNVWAVAVELCFEADDGARLMRRIMNALKPEDVA